MSRKGGRAVERTYLLGERLGSHGPARQRVCNAQGSRCPDNLRKGPAAEGQVRDAHGRGYEQVLEPVHAAQQEQPQAHDRLGRQPALVPCTSAMLARQSEDRMLYAPFPSGNKAE